MGRVCANYRGPALIEQFVEGYDVTVPVVGGPLRAMPPVLLTVNGATLNVSKTFTTDLKTSPLEGWIGSPADLTNTARLAEAALRITRAMDCRDVARVDFRVTPEGQALLLEVNTTPHLQPRTGPFAASAGLEGHSFADVVLEIVTAGLGRIGHSQNHRSPIS